MSEIDVVVSSGYIVLSNSVQLDKNYYKYFLHRFDVAFMKLLGSGVRQTLNYNDIANCDLVFPPITEQTRIATILDQKTAQIDQAIAQKERLIELLTERRQILIHNAVTRGLDPNVKMKDSGVEWIGEVPEHWKVIKAGKLSRIIRGASPRPSGDLKYFGGSDVNWITVGEITKDESMYLESSTEFLTNAGRRQSRFLNKGTFVLTNSGATLGVPKILNIDGCINDGVLAFLNIDEEKVSKMFFYYYFLTLTQGLREKMNQGATQPNLNTDLVKHLFIPIPTKAEQAAIVEYVETSSQKIATAITCKQAEIEKLKEYKATLINSVVTGKIKV